MTVSGVGVTAVAVAASRALESDRPDALVSDPWAALLVSRSGVEVPVPSRWPAESEDVPAIEQSMLLGASYIGLRTRLIDDELLAHGLRQAVILGSGLDTRAWRLDWPADARVFELDDAKVTDFLTETMADAGAAPRCERIPLAADVTEPWAARIVASGFSPGTPTHWVLEGLLPYLSAHDQRGVLDDIVALSTPGSRAVIERAPALTDSPETREQLRTFSITTGIPFDDLLARTDPPDPADALASAGWRTVSVTLEELENRYRRPLQVERDASGSVSQRGGFVLAERPL
jgi:methyltransferase (TIGR00027 family)